MTKKFGQVTALRGVDLTVRPGSLTALLGPNGAGKTTLVRIIATLTRPDAGRVSVLGRDVVTSPQQVRALIGLTGQYAGLGMAHSAVLAGRLASDAAVFAVQAVLVLGVGTLLGFRAAAGLAGLAGIVAAAVIFGVALAVTCSWLALLIADAETAERVLFFPFIVLAFISSAYAPASLLAGWLQPVARANLVTAAADLARSLAIGPPAAVPLLSLACWTAVLTIVPGVLAVRRWRTPA